MELTLDELDLITSWYMWAEDEGARCAWSPDALALIEKIRAALR